jgi:hypothetical protein
MFKTDSKSLEELSFSLSERDLANFKSILESLKKYNLLTINPEEIQRAISGLEAIGELKLDGKIYAFHVEDSFAARQSGGGEGVELYLRQGNKLEEFFIPGSRDYVFQVDEAAKYMQEKNKYVIYTGDIPFDKEFLGLHYECDDEDPIRRACLKDYEIHQFLEEKIVVIKLDSLI